MDENGRPVYDNSGNPMMEQKSVAYDPDAHSKIVALLDERAAANGDMRELFLEWRYVGADGDTKPWDVFKDEPIKGDMDLYPVTYRVVAKDTSDPAKSENHDPPSLSGCSIPPPPTPSMTVPTRRRLRSALPSRLWERG